MPPKATSQQAKGQGESNGFLQFKYREEDKSGTMDFPNPTLKPLYGDDRIKRWGTGR
jgi:hypothetical protein